MKRFDWTVVGAGPAGIAAVGKLIDKGVKPLDIAWVDPCFKVGDLGERWFRVSSNTKVKLFQNFLSACDIFRFRMAPDFEIRHLDPESTCLLAAIAEPLQWITDHLKVAAHPYQGAAKFLKHTKGGWEVEVESETFHSKKMILATGAIPKKLNIPKLQEIPLEVALNDQALEKENLENDTVAVFGASHSAIIVLQNLLKTGVKKVINFYNSPLKYALERDGWILFDNTGLKGEAAIWAQKHINGTWPERLERFHSESEEAKAALSYCTKGVYAIGFETRLPPETPQYPELKYNETNGIIGPGLFGLGIAYPQKVEDPLGNQEYNVGLWKFMNYLETVLPIWMNYGG